jgi:hypothetical protein
MKTILVLMLALTSLLVYGQSDRLNLPSYSLGAENNYFKPGNGDGGSLINYNSFLRLHNGLAIGSPFTDNNNGGYEEKATIGIDGRNGDITTRGTLRALNLIISNGKIGIGTVAPEQNLTVVMDQNENGTGVAVKAVNNGGAGSQPGYALLNPAGLKRMYSYLDVYTDTYNIANGNGSPLLTINQNGNLGLGTRAPDEKLSVNGKIHAQEVRIDVTNWPVWPDYVFEPDYSLRPLGDVKKYIELNHHLPEIPSAQEVSKEGINLGEMNAKLLKKVEELTLYLLELKKENELINDKLKRHHIN